MSLAVASSVMLSVFLLTSPAPVGRHGAGAAAGKAPVVASAAGKAPAARPVPSGNLYSAITEASGLVRTRSVSDLFWTHNDSLNPPVLFVIDRTGRCFAEFQVKDENIDWEALATDGHGNLYIGDIGNNEVFGMRMALRRVLRVREPDLSAIIDRQAGKPIRATLDVDATYSYTFPHEPFDAEALFVRGGNVYLISKVRGQTTRLYQVDTRRPGAARPLKEICALPQVQVVTDASLSEDGRQLAVISYSYVAVFLLDPVEPIENLAKRPPAMFRFPSTSVEGGCWLGPDELLLVAEKGPIYTLKLPAVGSSSQPSSR